MNTMKKTGIAAGLVALLGAGCTNNYNAVQIKNENEIAMPNGCATVTDFGIEVGHGYYRIHISCVDDNGQLAIYTRQPSGDSWDKTVLKGARKAPAEANCQPDYKTK